jgi:hypothetical protein
MTSYQHEAARRLIVRTCQAAIAAWQRISEAPSGILAMSETLPPLLDAQRRYVERARAFLAAMGESERAARKRKGSAHAP